MVLFSILRSGGQSGSSQQHDIAISSMTFTPPPRVGTRCPGWGRDSPGGQRLDHGHQFGALRGQVGHFGVELGQAAAQQLRGRLARAGAGVADREQLADLPQPVQRRGRVGPVASRGTGRRWEQSDPLVVADRVRAQARFGGQPSPTPSMSADSIPTDDLFAILRAPRPSPRRRDALSCRGSRARPM